MQLVFKKRGAHSSFEEWVTSVQQCGHQHLWCSDVMVLNCFSTFAGEGGMILMIEWKAIWPSNTSLDIENFRTRKMNAQKGKYS